MTQYVRMLIATGQVDQTSLRDSPPILPNGSFECKGYRWLAVVPPTDLSSWQSIGSLPTTVATNSTTISHEVITATLAQLKASRVAEIRNQQWNRIAAVYHIGQIINYYAIAIRLINKKASGQALAAPETALLGNIGAGVANNIEPICAAADACVTAISKAGTHAAVETAYAAIIWP